MTSRLAVAGAIALALAVGAIAWRRHQGRRAADDAGLRPVALALAASEAAAAHATFTGRVLDRTGNGAPRFEVTLLRVPASEQPDLFVEPPPVPVTTRTFTGGGDGAFELPRPAPGSYRVDVITPEGLSGSARIVVVDGRAAAVTVRLGRTLRGTVIDDQTGAPLEGVAVRLTPTDACEPLTVTSDAQGAFLIPAVPERLARDSAGREVELELRLEGPPGEYVGEALPVTFGAALERSVGTVRLVRGDWETRNEGGPWGLTGLWHEERGDKVYVSVVRPGQPAERAGIQVGEELVAIDGRPVAGLHARARSYLLKGPAGTPVAVTVRGPAAPPRTVTLVRQALARNRAEGGPGAERP